MALEWVRNRAGRADSKCGRYQMSITKTKGQNRYICFFVKKDIREPFESIGQRYDAGEARKLCDDHALGYTGD